MTWLRAVKTKLADGEGVDLLFFTVFPPFAQTLPAFGTFLKQHEKMKDVPSHPYFLHACKIAGYFLKASLEKSYLSSYP